LGDIYRDEYEQGERTLIETYLPPKTPVIELGGGIGVVSVHINRILDPGTTQVVLEPNKQVLPLLKRTKILNEADFDINKRAYSANQSEIKFYHGKRFWSASAQSKTGSSEYVSATNLQNICSNYGIERFTLVADIEGGEIDLSHELPFLEDYCDLAIIELHNSKKEHQDLSEKISKARDRFKKSTFEVEAEDKTKMVLRNPNID
jgi:FkbM family methyltransferase